MGALYTAASGMIAQQMNVDSISNNIANVNTTAYKKSRIEFKDMLYDTIQKAGAADQGGKPVGIQIGHGVLPGATVKYFSNGTMMETKKPLDLYIDGEGFFAVKGLDDQVYYTRDGSFNTAVTEEGLKLVTKEGYAVLDAGDNDITLDVNDPASIEIGQDGIISYTDSSGNKATTDQPIKLVRFMNPAGLENKGQNLYVQTDASGEAVAESEEDTTEEGASVKSVLKGGFLEASNVEIVEEMVSLIAAQRAYEINSKTIQAADEMLGLANNLRR